MTPLKFRALIDGRFVYSDGKEEWIDLVENSWEHKVTEYNGGYSVVQTEDISQYTGLKDKNGKEIYEGDVVLIPDTYTETVDVGIGNMPIAQMPDNHLCEVIFENGSFKFVITESYDVYSKGKYTYDFLEEENGIDELEVIGNIYQNKDLLT